MRRTGAVNLSARPSILQRIYRQVFDRPCPLLLWSCARIAVTHLGLLEVTMQIHELGIDRRSGIVDLDQLPALQIIRRAMPW